MNPGDEFGPSDWVEITQARIDEFASATGDRQWIHIDAARAADGPFGGTVAHGLLTLSLLPALWFEVAGEGRASLVINYGFNKVRFPAPVPVGSKVRAAFRVEEAAPIEGGTQARITATVERDGSAKPVCVAELVFRFLR